MRKLNILKACIDLAFYLSCLTVLAFAIFIPFAILGYMDGVPINMQGRELIIDNWQAKLVLFFVLISSLFFLYGIYLLRKTIALFIKKDLFNVEVIKNFNTIGICVVISTLLIVIPSFLYTGFHRTKFGFKIEAGFDSPLLVVSLGLFFMVLSEVFKIAKNLKEENDLTL
jgi:hypothetical protein